MRPRPLALAAALSVACAPAVRAHHVWLEPARFALPAGRPTPVRVMVGERFEGHAAPRDPGRIRRFALIDAGGARPVPGVAGAEPAGFALPATDGWQLLVYETRSRPIRLPAAAFERYLVEEGLERIVALRAARGESAAPGRERYSRCAKAILHVAGGAGSVVDRSLGCRFEIVPFHPPGEIGGRLEVLLLFDHRPRAGVLVTARPAEDPPAARSVRSDREGRATFTLDRPGPWLLEAVHMEPAEVTQTESDADWESWWASLTFAIAGR